MKTISRDAMVRKFKYLTNTTKTAIERRLPQKEVLCIICNKPVTMEELEKDDIECIVSGKTFKFFHRACACNH